MRTCQRWIGWGCGALLGALAAGVSSAQTNEFWNEFCLESAGVRYGFAANKTSDDFQEAAAFVNWYMPWRPEFGQGWLLRSRLDAAAGWLGDRSVDGFVASLGPSAVLSYGQIPLSLGVGASPT